MKIVGVGFHETYSAMPLHRDTPIELHYIIEGEADFECRGRRSRVMPGHFFAVFPDEPHRIIARGRTAYVRQYIVRIEMEDTDRALMRDLAARVRTRRYFFIGTNRRYFFEDVRRKWKANGYLAASAAHAIASLLYDCMGERTVTGHEDGFEQALQFLQSSLQRNILLADIARAAGVSRERAIRIFKERTGMPPLKFFSLLKIESAAGLLAGTGRTIEDIAASLAFTDSAHFSRVFKQYRGMPPGKYRELHIH